MRHDDPMGGLDGDSPLSSEAARRLVVNEAGSGAPAGSH
jgi:hypothetical protein